MERMEGLKRINSYEKYVEAKQRLEDYLKQYKWITESDAPMDDLFESLLECSKTRKIYENAPEEKRKEEFALEEKENEYRILSLKRQFDELKNGTYLAKLKRNITALFITVGEYEARVEKAEKEAPPSDYIDGLEEIKRDHITKGRYRRIRFFWASFTGLVPGEILNMDIEDKNEIPLFIKQKYGLISLVEPTPFENQQRNQAMVISDKKNDFSIRWFANPVTEFIASRGIIEMQEERDAIRDEIIDIVEKVESSDTTERAVKSPKNRKKGGKGVKRTDSRSEKDSGRDER